MRKRLFNGTGGDYCKNLRFKNCWAMMFENIEDITNHIEANSRIIYCVKSFPSTNPF